jgi:hypothetical protein
VIGPLLMFDKSFLQMLNPAEVSELSMYFKFVGTPLLIREIISDLKKNRKDRRMPEEVVSALASKMWKAHGVQPANFRKLAIANLCGFFDVPMIGQVPIDTSAPNAFVTDGGRGLLYDSTMEQEMWERWANGDFTTDDAQSASLWRAGVRDINLRAVGKKWKEYSKRHFGSARDLPELIALVNAELDAFDPKAQLNALVMLMSFLNFPLPAAQWATMLFRAGLIPRIKDLAPYATSILRLYSTFVGGLGRGFIGPRPSHFVDLQYLFYVPFCMVFASADKFHRDLWPATSGVNSFIWGPDLKEELQRRIEMRATMGDEEKRQQKFPSFPGQLQGGVIHSVWRKYIVVPMGDFEPMNKFRPTAPIKPAKTIDDLEPEVRDHIKNATKVFEEARRRRRTTAVDDKSKPQDGTIL